VQTPISEQHSGEVFRRLWVGRELGWIWSITAVAGAIAITASADDSPARFLLPVLAMAGLVVFGLRQPYIDRERLGDSVYFLGFLWTLYALIDQIVIKHRSADVMATFGYAVVTTACGMFLRLALTQFSYSTDVQILDTREQVQRGLQGLVDSLTSASQTIQAFEDLAARSQQQWETDVRTRMEKTIFLTASQAERIAEVFTATGNALAASMGDTGEALKAASKEVRIAGKKIVVDLATVGESVSTAAGAFGGSSKAIGQSAAVLSAELQRLAASVGPSLSASIAGTNLLDNLAGLSEDTMAFRSSATALLGGCCLSRYSTDGFSRSAVMV